MEMRYIQKWVSFNLSSKAWVQITREYNDALEKRNTAEGLPTIRKNPQALVEKLGEIEGKILIHLAQQNFTCGCGLQCNYIWQLTFQSI